MGSRNEPSVIGKGRRERQGHRAIFSGIPPLRIIRLQIIATEKGWSPTFRHSYNVTQMAVGDSRYLRLSPLIQHSVEHAVGKALKEARVKQLRFRGWEHSDIRPYNRKRFC